MRIFPEDFFPGPVVKVPGIPDKANAIAGGDFGVANQPDTDPARQGQEHQKPGEIAQQPPPLGMLGRWPVAPRGVLHCLPRFTPLPSFPERTLGPATGVPFWAAEW